MNKKQFRQFMMEEFKCPPDTAHVVNRIFDIFDTNGDGVVDSLAVDKGRAARTRGISNLIGTIVWILPDQLTCLGF